jgi:hypothetical protein
MIAVRGQVVMIGGEATLGRNPIKAIDELCFCRFTLKRDLGPITWLPGPGSRAPSPPPSRVAPTGGWPHGAKSAAMRALFDEGHKVADVGRAIGVDYAFAYSVHKAWLDKRRVNNG